MRRISLLLLTSILACSLARAADTPEQKKTALEAILADYWQDQLKHDPEMASALGDKRYDDQLSDYSVQAYNAALDRGRSFLDRLGAIDSDGLSEEEKHRKDQLVNKLIQDQQEAEFKPWELPVTDKAGLFLALPQLVTQQRFDTQQDYEHYIDRLKAVPDAFGQITTDLMSGIGDNNVLTREAVDQVIAQANAFALAKPEDSILALPLTKFPARLSPAERDNDRQAILSAIARRVLPAYTRFAKFLTAQYALHAASSPPAHAHAYMQEQSEVLALRSQAETALGAKFDLKAFREQVMDAVTAPPDIMAKHIGDWIAQQK